MASDKIIPSINISILTPKVSAFVFNKKPEHYRLWFIGLVYVSKMGLSIGFGKL